MSLLSTYFYGYSQAIDDLENERMIPRARGDDRPTRLPTWLQEMELERLAEIYADKH
jgi:hypothetical protein